MAKKHRDLQVTSWKQDWGESVTCWDFIDEPLEIVEWIAETLDREAILLEWHKERVREHRRKVYALEKTIAAKPLNKPMTLSRSV